MKKSNILVLGSGFIGKRIQQELKCGISGKKILNFKDAEELIRSFKPKIIINCIGHIGSNVDECEKDLDKTLFANTYIPIMLGELCFRHGIKLIHISSGCIFNYDYDSDRPIKEDKKPDFLDLFYSRSKIYAEQALSGLFPGLDLLLLRIRVPLDDRPESRNILDKLIRYKKVIDVPNSVTYLPDFMKALKHLIRVRAKGVFNVVNRGGLRYPALMDVYKKYRPGFSYRKIGFKELGLVRTNLVLSTEKLEKTGFKIRNINQVLDECVKNYLKY
ncbi:MAG: sugar nucleotide-binding protein [Candidatus Omnitrophica bacterium]|nr:sugar nucleotide-binding protein [Candidatus Omnitrophota bacterium]